VSEIDQSEQVEEQTPPPADAPDTVDAPVAADTADTADTAERPEDQPPTEHAEPQPTGERPAGRHESHVRTVDFSQPTKFTAELRRRVERVLGPFCEAFAIRLSTELRAPVELGVADSSQLTWAAAKAHLPANAIAVSLQVSPIERSMLLSIEPPMILQALELLLGGSAAQAPSERHLSEVDWALTRRLLESMTAQLAPAWRDLGGLELALGEVDLEGDAGVAAPHGEPTFAVTLASRIDGLPSTMSLLIPWSAIEPVAEEILGAGARTEDADPHEGRAVQRGLAAAPVQLRAEVGSVRMPVEQVLALTPGAVLTLDGRAEHGMRLYAEGVPLGRALPGLRGARRAVKLTSTAQPGPVHAELMAQAPVGVGAAHEVAADREPAAGHDQGAGDEVAVGDEAPAGEMPTTRASLARMMGIPVRVWAELGRATIPLGHALELPPGSVVELDQSAESPIELFVNGMPFAHGSLQVSGEGEWAVQVDALV
jgi:flagellar motor switch protein FliM